MIELLPSVLYAARPSEAEAVSGRTSSRDEAVGRRWSWELRVGDSEFAVWETVWSTGERELVLASQVMQASTPVSVANLMARRRALIEAGRDIEYMSARRVDPDADGWPRFSNCSENDLQVLIPQYSRAVLQELGYQGCATRMEVLGVSGPRRDQLLGVFKPGSRSAEVGFYVLTRLAPTFQHAGLLEA